MLKPYFQKDTTEAGCDEAGRGCLSGPVFAAAVILPLDFYHPLLNDSKQLNASQREKLRVVIEKEAVCWQVAQASLEEIEEINILQASQRAMHRSLAGLSVVPSLILVDGNYFRPYGDIPYHCVVKGDATFASIAAASILAKTYRDDLMDALHQEFPQYNWKKNKGYGTQEHRDAIARNGLSPYHRKTFRCQVEG